MKLEMQDMAGRRFYVLKPWHARLSDPDSFHAAKATENGRVYTTTSLRRLESLGAIIRAPPFAHGVVLVAKDAPEMLGGRAQGFWKLIQKRLRVKHASSSIDPHLIPELADLGAWLAEIRTGPVEDVPQLRASATLFPWSDEVLVSVKPEKTTTMVSARQKEITVAAATKHDVTSMAAVAPARHTWSRLSSPSSTSCMSNSPGALGSEDGAFETDDPSEALALSTPGKGFELSTWDWGLDTSPDMRGPVIDSINL